MYKTILKNTFFYYILSFCIVYGCVNLKILDSLRQGYLNQYANSSKPQNRILLYDYLAHLQPNDDRPWLKLAENYALLGDYSDAIAACHKAILINPQGRVYREALSYCYPLGRNNSIK